MTRIPARAPALAGWKAAQAEIELSPIKAMELRASRLPGTISLAQGIPSFDTPEPIRRYIVAKIEEGVCGKYSVSPGLPQLRESISEALRRDGMSYDPDGEIIVTCGSIEAIAATLLAFIQPGDQVIVASPTYASYLPAIRIAGGVPCFAPLNEDANFDLDPEVIEKAITRRTRAIVLCNPNNPTGTIYSVAETERMMELAEKHDLLVITDEVYKDFTYTNETPGSPARLNRYRERVVRVCSFSKAHAMTGWRVGFLHAARRRADSILSVHDALVTCAPVAAQYGAIAALEIGDEFVDRFREDLRRRRTRVIERLDALPHIFDYQMPNASYFAFPRVKDTVPLARDSRSLANDILERARVALVPGAAFGPTGESHLRICYAREEADVDRAFDRLADYFAGRSPRTYSLPAEPKPPAMLTARAAAIDVLESLARLYLSRAHPRIVAIAGHRGKTVLKRTLTELLARQFRVRSNPLSYNTEIGLLLSVLDATQPQRPLDVKRPSTVLRAMSRAVRQALFPEAIDVLIVELGARRSGDMRRLLSIVRPDIAVITPLAPGSFADPATLSVLRDEMHALVDSTRARGGYVVQCDNGAETEGLANDVKIGAANLIDTAAGRSLIVADRTFDVTREMVGDSGTNAVAAAVFVARRLGVGDEVIAKFLCNDVGRT
jgi:aminotransferase